MAANGSVEENGCAGELDKTSVQNTLTNISAVLQNAMFDHAFAYNQIESEERENGEEMLASCLVVASGPWINNKKNLQSSNAPLTLCSETDPEVRRTLRIERSGSTESVVTTSGVESCQSSSAASDTSSEPSSPSRPVTPQPMPPVPTNHCPYECLRADSEDSGLGPSPAKSLVNPASPEGSVSPIQFGRLGESFEDDRSDSLLDLSPRTDNSYEESEENNKEEPGLDDDAFSRFCLPLTDEPAIVPKSPKLLSPKSVSNGSSFQFLLSSTTNCVNINQTENFRLLHHSSNHPMVKSSQFPHLLNSIEKAASETFLDEQARRDTKTNSDSLFHPQQPLPLQSAFTKADCIKNLCNGLNASWVSSSSSQGLSSTDKHFIQNSAHLNPKVVLIRTNYDGGGRNLYSDESNSHQSSSYSARDSTPSDLCHELTSDCTSSNCSQSGVADCSQVGSAGSGAGDDGACKWLNCNRSADANTTATDLIDHIRECHVQSQPDDSKSYVCLWVGCKVYERPSCSRSWLERHVLLHGGSKPFRCIVEGCHQRFGSEAVLQRHVNSHFPQSRSKSGDHVKLLRRKQKHKHRKRPQFHKCKDYFDDASLEYVRHNLLQLSSIEGMFPGGPPSAITFHSTVIAKRKDEKGRVNVLLHWSPEDMVPDSWVAESDMCSNYEKTIPVSKLPPEALQLSSLEALKTSGILPRPGKRKRK